MLWLLAGAANAAALGTCRGHEHSLPGAHAEEGVASHTHASHTHDAGMAGTETVAGESATGANAAGTSDPHEACTCGALCCVSTAGAVDLDLVEASISELPVEEPLPLLPEEDAPAPRVLAPYFQPPSIGPPSA